MDKYTGFLVLVSSIVSLLTAFRIGWVLMARWGFTFYAYSSPFTMNHWFSYICGAVAGFMVYHLSWALVGLYGPMVAVAAVVAGPLLTALFFIYVVGSLKIFERMLCGLQKLQ